MIILGATSALLFPLGLIMGIASLVSMRRHGRQGAFGRAVVGVLLCGVLTVLMIISAPMVFRHMKQLKEKHQMEQRVR
jgi:hypothetical protein